MTGMSDDREYHIPLDPEDLAKLHADIAHASHLIEENAAAAGFNPVPQSITVNWRSPDPRQFGLRIEHPAIGDRSNLPKHLGRIYLIAVTVGATIGFACAFAVTFLLSHR